MSNSTDTGSSEKSAADSLPLLWKRLIIVALGVIAGMGLVLTDLSRAISYLSDEPETCVNCHVMNTQYATWQHSAHSRVATCNDCHVPHDNIIHSYLFKAQDGLRHASMFALRLEDQVIRLKEGAVGVIKDNCKRCHQRAMQNVVAMQLNPGEERVCWDCHKGVPHGTVRSLSTTPEPMRPQLPEAGKGTINLTIGDRKPRAKEKSHE